MDTLSPNIGVCALCGQLLNLNAPHAIVNHDYAHLACADDYDSRDRGSPDLDEAYNEVTRRMVEA